MTTVFAAIPTGELSRYPQFWQSVMSQQLPAGVALTMRQCRGTLIANGQAELARAFLASGADYFWLLNDDQVYPPDTLAKLLAHDVDVVGPVCLAHDYPFKPLICHGEEGEDGICTRFLTKDDHGLVWADAVGGGGMLVKRRVFEAVADPWWEQHTARPGGGPPVQTGEDIGFCRAVRAAGFSIWADTDCLVGHSTVFEVRPHRTESGEWQTALVRRGHSVVVGAAP